MTKMTTHRNLLTLRTTLMITQTETPIMDATQEDLEVYSTGEEDKQDEDHDRDRVGGIAESEEPQRDDAEYFEDVSDELSSNLSERDLLHEIKACESDQDLKSMIEAEEAKGVLIAQKAHNVESVYKKLYRKSLSKMLALMKLLRKLADEKGPKDNVHHRRGSTSVENELKKRLEIQSHNNLYLKSKCDDLERRNKDLFDEAENLRRQLLLYKGDDKGLSYLDYETLIGVEQQLIQGMMNIATFKNKLITKLEEDKIKHAQAAEDCKKCLICQSKNFGVILKPCNHVCVCDECSTKIKECPLDRKPIITVEKVYLT
eukprot:TRINITY_DN2507_c0_g2_i3.p1 TRINITY_DN2507_c0_g2~~TRINITY_DN2507_c0_g2_i3.p1  ORF type:complete len:316 (+),score=50.39 TRINITY_DN2507_c0_g2_i3:197-1144(+)